MEAQPILQRYLRHRVSLSLCRGLFRPFAIQEQGFIPGGDRDRLPRVALQRSPTRNPSQDWEGPRKEDMGDGGRGGRDGMVYGGVTMGKCFYCMLLGCLLPPPITRRARVALRSAIFLRRFRASRSGILRGAFLSRGGCDERRWPEAARKRESRNLSEKVIHHWVGAGPEED